MFKDNKSTQDLPAQSSVTQKMSFSCTDVPATADPKGIEESPWSVLQD